MVKLNGTNVQNVWWVEGLNITDACVLDKIWSAISYDQSAMLYKTNHEHAG